MLTTDTSEALLRQTTPIFINSFNQLTYLRDTVFWFHDNGFRNIFVLDNASSYDALLDFFACDAFTSKARLVELGDNRGPRKALLHAQSLIGPNAPFIFTDPDLLLPSPIDPLFLSRMFAWGTLYHKPKVGLALTISEDQAFKDIRLAASFKKRSIREWEQKFWWDDLEENVYSAAVDTTFFLHVPVEDPEMKTFAEYGKRQARIPALRIAGDGFEAKHRPWYIDDGQTDEERAFYVSLSNSAATWSNDAKQKSDPS